MGQVGHFHPKKVDTAIVSTLLCGSCCMVGSTEISASTVILFVCNRVTTGKLRPRQAASWAGTFVPSKIQIRAFQAAFWSDFRPDRGGRTYPFNKTVRDYVETKSGLKNQIQERGTPRPVAAWALFGEGRLEGSLQVSPPLPQAPCRCSFKLSQASDVFLTQEQWSS